MPEPILRRVHSTALLQESQGEKLACLQFRPVAYWKHWINRQKKRQQEAARSIWFTKLQQLVSSIPKHLKSVLLETEENLILTFLKCVASIKNVGVFFKNNYMPLFQHLLPCPRTFNHLYRAYMICKSVCLKLYDKSYGHNFPDTLEAYIMTRQFASYSPFNLEFLIIEAKRKLSHSWKANGITDLDCNFSCDMLPKMESLK